MLSKALLIVGLLLLSACSTVPERALQALPAAAEEFSISARFALRQELPEGNQRSLSGRLSWSHRRDGDHLLLADPLGRGLAELWQSPAGARLKLADGRELSAPAAETLLTQLLGYPLPVSRMAGWLTGRQAGQRDRLGRAERLDASDWTIEFAYDSEATDAPPARLTLRHTGQGELAGMELRLRIEEWSATP